MRFGGQRGAEFLYEYLGEPAYVTYWRSQIVRHRVGEGFQFLVGDFQFGSTLNHPPLQALIERLDLPFRSFAFSDIAEHGDASAEVAMVVLQGPC